MPRLMRQRDSTSTRGFIIGCKENGMTTRQLAETVNLSDWSNRLLRVTNRHEINIHDIIECLNNGANVNCKGDYGWTPLLYAIYRNHFESVKLLISRGANINEINDASLCNQSLRNILTPEKCAHLPLQYSILQNNEIIAQYLVNKGANVCKADNTGKTALSCAIEKQNINMIEFLLDHGAKYTIPTAFLEAIDRKNLEIIQLLEEKGSDFIKKLLRNAAVVNKPDSKGKFLLSKFIDLNNMKWLKFMIKSGATLDTIDESEGNTPLTKAIENVNEEIVNELLDNGADVNKPDFNGNHPLIKSIKLGHFEIAKILVENGANVNLPDSDGNVPLIESVEMGDLEMVKILFASGADLKVTDKFGDSSFIKALRKERFEMVKYFVEQGEDVNQMNDKKETPLSIAASNNDYRSFQLLIDYGADIGLATEKLEELASSDINLDTYIKSLNEENIIKKEQFSGASGQEDASSQ